MSPNPAPYKFASPPDGCPRRSVALAGDVAPESLLLHVDFPWTYAPGNVPIIHRSSVFMAVQAGVARGFDDDRARSLYATYAAEGKRSFGPHKLAPSEYDWTRHLTRAWKPLAYQRAGMDRLYARAAVSGGTVLGDDVGLGKTVMAIGVAERLRARHGGLVLVVTTISTLGQWKDEVLRFARAKPGVVVADGPGRAREIASARDWLVTSYETIRLPQFADAVARLSPTVLVFDEAYRLSNRETQTQLRAHELATRSRAVYEFNATPIENGAGDLFGQLRCIDKDLLGGWDRYDARYLVRSSTGREIGTRNLRELKLRTAAVILRRTAAECGAEVPRVVAEVRRCVMSSRQEKAYVKALGDFVGDTSTGAVSRAKLARVRYAAFAADISDPSSDSCKCDDLVSLLTNELRGQRVVVISRFTRVVDFVRVRLRAAGISSWVITGDTPRAERSDIRRRFASRLGRGRVLLGSEAIQRGMNLQSAGVLVNLDLPWTAAALRQRVGRIARIGQRRDRVLVLNQRAVASRVKTVDPWIESIVVGKRGVFDDFFGDDGVDELGSDAPSIAAVREYLAGTYKDRKGDT